MPVKRRKDRTHLVTTFDLKSQKKPHYVRVYLWANHAAMLMNTVQTDEATIACHCPNSFWEEEETGARGSNPLLGELHFVMGEWTSQIVAHELQHAIIHRMRVIPPHATAVIDGSIEDEEEICYEFGIWWDVLFGWMLEQHVSAHAQQKEDDD